MIKSPIIITIVGVITVSIVVGSVIYYYRRETTSIEDKYMYRDSEEIDALYHQTYLDKSFLDGDTVLYSDDTVRDDAIYKNYTVPNPYGDIDGDGLTNQQEYEYGTDPFELDTDGDRVNDKDEIDQGTQPDNPDSDGDGISDGQDPYPNDPTKGGAGSPPGDGGGGDSSQPVLAVNQFYKHVCNNADELCDPNQGKDDWKQFVYAKPGDLISFFIYIQLNTSDLTIDDTATLTDFFGSNLEYRNNAMLRINNDEIIMLDDFQYPNGAWYSGLPLFFGTEDVMIYEIYFKTTFQPQSSQSAINLARLELKEDVQENNILDRRAFVFKK